MLLLRDAQTGGDLPPKRRMETAHERLLPNRLAVQHAGAGDSNTANTIAVLHPACRTDANTLVPCRTDGLHHTDTHLELCRGSDVTDVERVEQFRKFLYYSYCILPHALGEYGHARRLCHRLSNVECRSRKLMCIANAHLYQRTTLRYIHILHVYSDGLSHVHPTRSTDANCGLRNRPNRLHHADTHVELCDRRDLADLERVDQLRQLMHYSHRVLHHALGSDGHPR